MSKPYAYRFYHSQAWKDCRRSYAESVYWLCERCAKPGRIVHHSREWIKPTNINDPNITLGWWNLELLCDECHNNVHHGGKEQVVKAQGGYMFDEDGNLVQAL